MNMKKFLFVCAAFAAVMTGCKKDVIEEVQIQDIILTSPANGAVTLVQDESYRVKYTIVPETATESAIIEWSVDNPDIASVRNGKITALAPGQTVVTAKCGNVKVPIKVRVKGIPVTSFTVPDVVPAYYGQMYEIPLTVEPKEANAASLNWYVEDENIATVHIEDGKAYISAVSSTGVGETTLSVSCEGMEPRTVTVNAYSVGAGLIYSYADRSILFQDPNGKEIDFNYLVVDSEQKPWMMFASVRKHTKVTVSVENEKICSAKLDIVANDTYGAGMLTFTPGTEYGTTGVTLTTIQDGLTFTTEFSLRREKVVFPEGVCIYNNDKKRAMADQEDVIRGQTLNLIMTKDRMSFPAKWTSSNTALATVKSSDGSKAVVTVNSNNTGAVTITATDEAGTSSKSVVLNIVPEKFTDGIHLIDATTGQAIDKTLAICEYGKKMTLRLSENCKYPKWSCTGSATITQSKSNPYEAELNVKTPQSDVTVVVEDEAGAKKISYKFRAFWSVTDLNFCNYSSGIKGKRSGLQTLLFPFNLGENNELSFSFGTSGYTVDLDENEFGVSYSGLDPSDSFSVEGETLKYSSSKYHYFQLYLTDKFGKKKSFYVKPCLDQPIGEIKYLLYEEFVGKSKFHTPVFSSSKMKFTSIMNLNDADLDYSWYIYSKNQKAGVSIENFQAELTIERCLAGANCQGYNASGNGSYLLIMIRRHMRNTLGINSTHKEHSFHRYYVSLAAAKSYTGLNADIDINTDFTYTTWPQYYMVLTVQ